MMTRETHEDRTPTSGSRLHQLLPVAGVTVIVVAVLAHLAGGAALAHFGLGAVLAYFGADAANLSGGALLVGLAAIIFIKLLVVFGARRWLRHR